MNPVNRTIAAAVLSLGMIPLLFAQSRPSSQVNIDPGATDVHYTVGTLLHTVHGTFKARPSSITFDPQSGAANGEIDIDAASGNSGNGSRDKKMTKEVLEAPKYPVIAFLPKQIVGDVNSSTATDIQLKGIIRIHGQDHEIAVPVHLTPSHGALEAQLKFDVPYVAWGMKNPSTFVLTVDKIVHIEIDSKVSPQQVTH